MFLYSVLSYKIFWGILTTRHKLWTKQKILLDRKPFISYSLISPTWRQQSHPCHQVEKPNWSRWLLVNERLNSQVRSNTFSISKPSWNWIHCVLDSGVPIELKGQTTLVLSTLFFWSYFRYCCICFYSYDGINAKFME